MDWALSVLRQRLLSFPAWRQPIYHSSTERRAALSLTETLPTLVANTPFATAWDMGTHVDTMSPDTTLQRVPHVLIELIDKSCRITDRTTGHSTTVESPIEMTIVWILHQTGAFTLADCQAASPHLPAHKIHEQISMLIKMGALYRLPLPRAKPTKLS
jgi:hypothetical protein